MSVRRALVDCVVLSVQDSSVFYPSCRGCFSRIDVEQRDTARCRCSRCGYLCLREEINYRYRLSLRVSRDKNIFGVTVFGSNLNKFFGIDATGLQRLVENTEGSVEPSRKFTLLLKAIEDCFIGRHFIFCMKLTENDSRPWKEGPASNCSSTKNATHFIATQMILPKASGLGGCAVVTYYQKLLQKASDSQSKHSDASRFPTTQLLLTPYHSPASSFNATLPSPHFLFQSMLRSQHLDCALSPTPPWQQSLGVVTSSAEQEESGILQACGDENSRQTDNSAMRHWEGRDCLQRFEATEKSAVFHLEQSLSSPSYAKYPNSLFKESVRTSSTLNTSFTLSQTGHNTHNDQVAASSTKELTRTLPSISVDWEDLPLSESLTEFICGENKDFDIVIDTEPNINVLCRKNIAGNHVEITNLTSETTSAGKGNAPPTESHSQVLLDASNVPNRQRFSDQVFKDFLQQENQSQARSIHSPRFDQENELKLYFENEEKDFMEDAYNCSADLFGNSSLVNTNAEMLSCKAETVGTTTELCPLSLKPDPKHLKSPREDWRLNSSRSYNRDSLTIQDFVPPSQSTPNVKAFVSHSFTSQYRTVTHEFHSRPDRQDPEALFESMCELNSKMAVNATSVLPQLNSLVSAGQWLQCGKVSAKENLIYNTTPNRCSYKRTTGRRLRKPDQNKNTLPAHRHFQVQRRSRNLRLSGAVSHRRDSGVSTESVCDTDNSDMLVPPTPAGKIQRSVVGQQTRLLGSCSSRMASSIIQQQRVADDCQTTVNCSHRGEGPTKCVADEGNLDLSNDCLPVDESWTGDWSRDLFSDSV